MAKEYDHKKVREAKATDTYNNQFANGNVPVKGEGSKIIEEVTKLNGEEEDVEVVAKGEVEEDVPPALEEVDEETRRQEELQKTKDQKNKEWLDKVVAE